MLETEEEGAVEKVNSKGGKSLGGGVYLYLLKEGTQDWILDFDLNEVGPKAVSFGWETHFRISKFSHPDIFTVLSFSFNAHVLFFLVEFVIHYKFGFGVVKKEKNSS